MVYGDPTGGKNTQVKLQGVPNADLKQAIIDAERGHVKPQIRTSQQIINSGNVTPNKMSPR